MRWVIPALLLLSQSGTLAQSAPQKTKEVQFNVLQSLVQRSLDADGKAEEILLKTPQTVRAGDLLQEDITVKNVGGKVLPRMLLTLPLPEGTTYAGQATPTASRWKLQYSSDGGKTYSSDSEATVTHVRWVISNFPAGSTLKFRFRVKVK